MFVVSFFLIVKFQIMYYLYVISPFKTHKITGGDLLIINYTILNQIDLKQPDKPVKSARQ